LIDGTRVLWSARVTVLTTGETVDGNALLLAMAQRRDRAAFALLFRHYAPRLKSHLLGRGVDDFAAEELVQEVMLAAWRRAESFDPQRGAASSWLFTIARNALIDRVRRERRPEPEPEPEAPDTGRELTSPEAELLARESQLALQRALLRLPPEQSAVLRDAYFRGRTMSEIAAERNLPIGTVKTRTRLALERLRNEIAGSGAVL
jgi:RNA polymerase sigma factor (sigma-70 family)